MKSAPAPSSASKAAINNTLQKEKEKVRVAERPWLRKGWQLVQVVGIFLALGLLWVLISSTSVQAIIYNAVITQDIIPLSFID